MSAQQQLVWSLTSLLKQVDSGAIQDTALPGTSAAEATRLQKNGLSVSAYACFEHFIRERITELLEKISTAPDRPEFHDLPLNLQTAATKGVVDALRFRLNMRAEGMDVAQVVDLSRNHARAILSSAGKTYEFSALMFGWSTSNVGPSTLSDFFNACGAPNFFTEFEGVLRDMKYDYAAAGLTENGSFRLRRLAGWRHEAAHDATLSIDIQLLRTRITAYLALACAFDFLASLAVRILVDSFGPYGSVKADRRYTRILELTPDGVEYRLSDASGTLLGQYFSILHCQQDVGSKAAPLDALIVVRDQQGQAIDWIFC